jgi:hypothetical protein
VGELDKRNKGEVVREEKMRKSSFQARRVQGSRSFFPPSCIVEVEDEEALSVAEYSVDGVREKGPACEATERSAGMGKDEVDAKRGRCGETVGAAKGVGVPRRLRLEVESR